MAPNEVDASHPNTISEKISSSDRVIKNKTDESEFEKFYADKRWFWEKYELIWWKINMTLAIHVFSLYCAYHYPYINNYKTTLWTMAVAIYSQFGICAGAHRLWSHRSFKANALLRAIIAIGFHMSLHMPIESWVRKHRVHHRYTDTPADPHNSKQGFFYCHYGWIFTKPSKLVKEKYAEVDLTDIKNDKIVQFTDRWRHTVGFFFGIIATAVPVYFWNETWGISFMAQVVRFIYVTHATASINSFAHMFGNRPFNKKIAPVESKLVVFLTNGDGWHNYHHSFPVDYRSAEIGGSTRYDINARLIEFFAKLGWAWDLKTPKPSLVKMTMERKGDASILSSMIS